MYCANLICWEHLLNEIEKICEIIFFSGERLEKKKILSILYLMCFFLLESELLFLGFMVLVKYTIVT